MEPAEPAVHPLPPTPRAPEAPPRWAPGNLTLRLITAALLIPPVIFVCFTGGWLFVAVVIAFPSLVLNQLHPAPTENLQNIQIELAPPAEEAPPIEIK